MEFLEEFLEEQGGGVAAMNSSLRMKTERSLRSDVKDLERFVGEIIKTALAFLNLEQSANGAKTPTAGHMSNR